MYKQRLSWTELHGFFPVYLEGLYSTGLLEPLQRFQTSSPHLQRAIRSWWEALSGGASFASSLQQMVPAFPSMVEELLILGEQRGALDRVVSIFVELQKAELTELEVLERLTKQWNQWLLESDSEASVCEDCLERELRKLFLRAAVEGASEVRLQQEDDEFLRQYYLGIKLIQIVEPCHSRLFHGLLQWLREAAVEEDGAWKRMAGDWMLQKLEADSFLVTFEQQRLLLRFLS